MAVTARGAFPLRSAWLDERRGRQSGAISLLYRVRVTDYNAPWTDWAFEAPAGEGITGSVAVTLDAFTQTSAGAVQVGGAASQTLGTVTQAATGALIVSGAASATLGDVTQAAAGAVGIAGALSQGLGAVTLSATGEQPAQPVNGEAAMTLGAVTGTAVGSLRVSGQASGTLGSVTQAATGALRISGAVSLTIDAVTASADGALVVQTDGVLAVTLGAVCMSATSLIRNKRPRTKRAYGDHKRGGWKHRR